MYTLIHRMRTHQTTLFAAYIAFDLHLSGRHVVIDHFKSKTLSDIVATFAQHKYAI